MNGLIDTVLCQLIWWPCLRCVLWSLEIFRLSSKVQALAGDSPYSCTLCPELPTQCTHGLGILTAVSRQMLPGQSGSELCVLPERTAFAEKTKIVGEFGQD